VKGNGIGFINLEATYIGLDMIFVKGALIEAGDQAFPDTRVLTWRQSEALLVPSVEIPRDINVPGVRRPDGEIGAVIPIPVDGMCSQLFIKAEVAALVKKIEIIFAEQTESLTI